MGIQLSCLPHDGACQKVGLITGQMQSSLIYCFVQWRIYALQTMGKRSRHQNVILSDRLARLQQTVEDQNATIRRLFVEVEAPEMSSPRKKGAMCRVCAETSVECICCSAGHAVCLQCVDRHCFGKLDAVSSLTNGLACFSVTECDKLYSNTDVMRTQEGERFIKEMHHARTMEHVCDLLGKKSFPDKVALPLRYMRADGSFRGLACPRCQYGPMEHAFCEDLAEWHERDGYNNSCPKCGFIPSSSTSLVPWHPEFG